MTDQQLLEIQNPTDKTEISLALKNKISDLDFEIDIELIFSYILCAKRLTQQIEVTDTEMLIPDTEKDLLVVSEVVCHSPEKLIEHFNTLYNNPKSRFNKSLWSTAIRCVKKNQNQKLINYCKPIADFLTDNPFLKSDILTLIKNAFPFAKFFPDQKEQTNKEFWQQYIYSYNLLYSGNIELDLLAHTVNSEQYTAVQLDNIYKRLLCSAEYYRQKQYAQAFNVLSEGIPADTKPLMVWQREINILFKAAFIEQEEQVAEIFINTYNTARSYFPTDEYLLYLQVKYILHTCKPEIAKDLIIAIVKIVPHYPECMFLLGKCYMQLGIYRAAMIIFKNIEKLDPLNLQYTIAGTKAKRAYIDFCMAEHNLQGNSKQYYITIVNELIEYNMFDEAATFASEAPKDDTDLVALALYATEVRNFDQKGIQNKEALFDALLSANDAEIRRKIKEHYLRYVPHWPQITEEKKFIQTYYEENPTDTMANYYMGMYFYSTSDFQQAYDFLLKAKTITPSEPIIYHNLALAASSLDKYEEAVEYMGVYLSYNKYQLQANEYYCQWAFASQQHSKAHKSAKWILSICQTNEFKPVHFFYFAAGLKLYLCNIPEKYHNVDYIYESLELFDQYQKPDDFLADEDGLRSLCWAAMLCYDIDDYEKSLDYVKQALPHITDYNSPSAKMGLFGLLPQCLYTLQRYEEIIQFVAGPTLQVLNDTGYQYDMAPAAIYLSSAYGAFEQYEAQMEWSLICVNCYIQSDNPPIDWIENYLTDKFNICVEHGVNHYIILIGAAYLDLITATNQKHIWMAYNMANTCKLLGYDEEALEYHHKCLAFGQECEHEFEKEITTSQAFINNIRFGNLN